MSKDRHDDLLPPSNLAVLRAGIKTGGARLAQSARTWIRHNKALALIFAGVFLLTIPVVATYVSQSWRAAAVRPTRAKMTSLLVETLAAVDAAKFRQARTLTSRLDLAYIDREQTTIVEFILGALAADEAEEYVGADRGPRFREAVVHLKRCRELGFPYQHESQATYLLGKCLFHSGELTESREFLEEALTAQPQQATDIHGMLAEAYRWGTNPDFNKALQHNRSFVAAPALSDDERQLANLREAELYWKLNDIAHCGEALDRIPAESASSANAAILRGRILVHDAETARAALPADADADEDARNAVRKKFQEALAVLRRAQQDPLNTQVIGKAMYLIGICYLKLEDTSAALDQLRRTSRIYENTPEGLAAGLEEADLLRHLGQHDRAVPAYAAVFDGIGRNLPGEADNPWVTREQFRTRALEAYNFYLVSGDFARCTRLVGHIAPLVQPARAAELAAELHRDWARLVLLEAEQASEPAATEERKRGRLMLREAAMLYSQAAKLNFSERQYTEHVWQSAECYLLGHNFSAAIGQYEEYMKYEAKRRRSSALVGLGECLLSLGRPTAALDTLKQCYELMPNDIATYAARLLASKAYAQLGNPAEAEKLLRENIGGNLLTPESQEWRDSLFALGRLLVREQRHDEAIKVLSEAVSRYPESQQSVEARYLVAEEFRLAAKGPQAKAKSETIATARAANLKLAQQFLTASIEHYEDAQRMLNAKQVRVELSPLEQAILRNSYFAAGMALMDLGRYEDAIRAYSTATNRYQHTPEVLEAFVQIAGCYRRLNRPLEARGTVRQAKVVLNRMAQDAPYAQATNFSRKQWEDLLNWMITL
jgi:tetratricopeptide (TPR) repeat protein